MNGKPWSYLFLFLMLLGSACTVLQGQELQERPLAPDFVLKTSQGERCALADFRGKTVALYMTNL